MSTPRKARRKAGFATFGVLVACALPAASQASDIPDPPSAPCTLGTRMNVHIINGWMYECECTVLAHGFNCQWNLVGEVAAPALKRFRRHAHKRLVPVLVIHALPGVVG